MVPLYSTPPGWRELDLKHGYLPFLQGHGTGKYFSDAVFWANLKGLPVLLKGLPHPTDAERAVEHGVDGPIVSNHGAAATLGGPPALAVH